MQEAVRIQHENFSQDEEIRELRATSKRMGGIGTFLGCARDFSEGREVSEINFDAYGPMALAEMNHLRSEAIEKFGLLDARIVHRIGTVRRGEHRLHRHRRRTPRRRTRRLPLDHRRIEGTRADLEEGDHAAGRCVGGAASVKTMNYFTSSFLAGCATRCAPYGLPIYTTKELRWSLS